MRIPQGVPNVDGLKARLGKLRLFQFAIIASIPMFGRVAEFGRPPGSSSWTVRHWVVAGLALWAVSSGASIRGLLISRAEKALAKDASDPKALKQWESGQVLGLAFAESLALWGFVVRTVLGGALWQALLFYSAGFLLVLFWTPRLPEDLGRIEHNP
jgi:F0F1-type ATP synthase membrane subunit c/vacuolar-type H+-ATPase subunit K